MSFVRELRSLPMLVCILAIIATSPLRADRESWATVLNISFWTLCTAAAAIRLSPGRKWYRSYITAVVIVILSMFLLLTNIGPATPLRHLISVCAIVIESLAIFVLLNHSFAESRGAYPTADRLISVIGAYFLLAMLWESFYHIILLQNPNAIVDNVLNQPVSDAHLLYYSLVTQTTQGYGDIVPTTSVTRYLAGFQGAIGTIYLGVLVAVLIGIMQKK